MGVTVVVCAAFGLSPYRRPRLRSRIYVRRGCRSPSQIFSLEAAGQVYNQTNEFVYLWRNVNHNADLVQRNQSAQTQRMVQLSEVHPRTVRPTGRSPRAQNPDAKSRGTQDNAYGCVTWGPPRVPPPHAAPSPPQLPDSMHRLAKAQSRWPPDSYLDTLIKTGSESTEATLRKRRILCAGFVARVEDMRLPKSVMFGEMVRGAGCVGGQEKEWMGCFLDDLRDFGINADQ